MKTIVDFHIHSKYARATSKFFDLQEMVKWADIKGVDIVACGDFTHPTWFKSLEENLIEINNSGIYQLKGNHGKAKFILATELSCIYSQGGKTRRVHLCILMPSLTAVAKFNRLLNDHGAKLASDGRPILGLSAKQVLQIMLEADSRAMMIPAHAWTPWFAVFGSKSGFDSLSECFEDLTSHIKAIETGLSSDPLMNWRLKELDNITLVSNSDAHSGPQIGREANVFDLADISYQEIIDIISTKNKDKFLYTIEFFPEEGMYHIDGHRSCNFSCLPEETKKLKGLCPKCRKPLTIGVLSQIEKMADYTLEQIDRSKHIPYKSIIPLPNIIADYFKVGRSSKKVESLFQEIIAAAGNEFTVLLDWDFSDLKKIMPESLAQGILRMRRGEINLIPGFDGEYGRVEIFSPADREKAIQQNKLF